MSTSVMLAPEASLGGVPLKYISLVTLTLQNSVLTVLLHYSRLSVAPNERYSAATAVLTTELVKGVISFGIAWKNAAKNVTDEDGKPVDDEDVIMHLQNSLVQVKRNVFSPDCWKLAVPSVLYVLQNNLQFVAASNLDVPTFQVTYNLKVLTTAVFSVVLLKRRLSLKKWAALFLLALGVGIVQIQSSTAAGASSHAVKGMNQLKGLSAVALACVTSGLAGVYFEMVLKGTKADIWTRNVQLSFFSLLPALLPVLAPNATFFGLGSSTPAAPSQPAFAYFGFWAWSVVACQVIGGLVTALVVKYSDNIVKGFATSLAIILSFLAGIFLFNFEITHSFVLGTLVVVLATLLYSSTDRLTTQVASSFSDAASAPARPSLLPSTPLTRKFSKSEFYTPDHPSPLSREAVPLMKEYSSPATVAFQSYHRHAYHNPSTPDATDLMNDLPSTPPSPSSPLLSQVLFSALESTGKTFQEKLDEAWVPMSLHKKKSDTDLSDVDSMV